eukprot:scaffold10022_cov156-Skeletonema_marinoi.AAC.19
MKMQMKEEKNIQDDAIYHIGRGLVTLLKYLQENRGSQQSSLLLVAWKHGILAPHLSLPLALVPLRFPDHLYLSYLVRSISVYSAARTHTVIAAARKAISWQVWPSQFLSLKYAEYELMLTNVLPKCWNVLMNQEQEYAIPHRRILDQSQKRSGEK